MSARPITFTAFCKFLGVELTRGQRVLCRVCFDGDEPRDLVGDDAELARLIFGDVDEIAPEARAVVVAVVGAGAGKSYLASLRLLHLALTVPLDGVAPGEIASALVVAPDVRLSRVDVRYALGAARSAPAIASRIRAETADSFTIEREAGRHVTVEALPATAGGRAVRGRRYAGAILDEGCFFRSSDFEVNDAELVRAIAPRVLPEGQLCVVSTPWAEAGIVFEMYSENFGSPKDAIAAHAATTTLRDDARTIAMVERERLRSPENHAREFMAQFMTSGAGTFFDPAAVDACVDETRAGALAPSPGDVVGCGCDFGFRSDSSAMAIVALRGDTFELAHLDELRPTKGAPLVPGITVDTFAASARAWSVRSVAADSHYQELVRERLHVHGIALVPAPPGAEGKATTYLALRSLVNARRIRLPRHERLLRQMKELTSKALPGGGLVISSPRSRSGGHGDLVSSLVLAVFMCRSGSYDSADIGRTFGVAAAPGFWRTPLRGSSW
jgi:hypothetical protein